jgi:Xaa-Pro dipeptidase
MFPLERHRPYLTGKEELQKRLAAFQAHLQTAKVDAAWIDHPADRFYFTGSIQDGTLLLPATGEPGFYVRRSRARAEQESPLPVRPFPGRRGLAAAATELLPAGGRLGLCFDVTSAGTYLWLQTQLPGIELADITLPLKLQKAVKSDWERQQIRTASEKATILFDEIDQHLRAGITELELSASVERRLRLLGHGGTIRIRRPGADLSMLYAVSGDGGLYPTNFDGPVGAEGLYPFSSPGSGWKRIVAGETVMLDMVFAYNGYHTDNARTFFVGAALPERARAAHQMCLDTLAYLEARLRPGTNCAELFRETQAWVEQQGEPEGFMGFGDNRVKFFGHGVGLELDEFPILADRVDLDLAAGMVVAVEPKAFLAGIGPVGLENTYVIGADGCESLCSSRREIVVVK